MKLKGLIDEDFVNYKKPSMTLEFPVCSFKCNKECGVNVCQNYSLMDINPINIDSSVVVQRYLNNDITQAVCCQGLEPLDSFEELIDFIDQLRKYSTDDIVIYTGYYENEIKDYISRLQCYSNIIVKFGRFIPNQKDHYDELLGINLASDNQYAVKIS